MVRGASTCAVTFSFVVVGAHLLSFAPALGVARLVALALAETELRTHRVGWRTVGS